MSGRQTRPGELGRWGSFLISEFLIFDFMTFSIDSLILLPHNRVHPSMGDAHLIKLCRALPFAAVNNDTVHYV